jgi:membrane protein
VREARQRRGGLASPGSGEDARKGARDDAAVRRAVGTVIDIGRRSLRRFLELEGMDRSMALAGQAFAALMPLLIVVGAAYPSGGRDLADSLIRRMHLSGEAATTMRAAVAQPAEVQQAASVLGAAVLVISALSFTRALQRLYIRAWGLPKLGMHGNAWGLIWLAAAVAFWSLQPLVAAVFHGVAATVVSIGLSCVVWLFTPWILVGKAIHWRRLVPQAILTASGLTALAAGSAIYMPRALESAADRFGFLGVAFSLVSWLFVAALILVAAAALGSVLVEPAATAPATRPPGDEQPERRAPLQRASS